MEPSEQDAEEARREIASRGRVRRRANRDFRQHFNRQGFGAAIVVALLGPLIYWADEGTKRASGQVAGWVLSGAAPLGALVVGTYLWSLFRAKRHLMRDELVEANGRIAELTADVDELNTKVGAFADRLAVTRVQLGVELRAMRHRIEIVRSTRPHPQYSHGFALPTTRWDDHGNVLAGSLELFRAVEPAYAAVTHLHGVLEMRRTRAGNPTQQLAVIAEDRLDDVYDKAGVALDALGEERGEVWQSDYDRAVSGVVEDLLSDVPSDIGAVLSAKYAQALLSAHRDIVTIGEQLLRELEEGNVRERVPGDLRLRAERWISRSIAWANDTNSPLSAQQRQAFQAAPGGGPLPIAMLADIVANNLDALRAVRDLIEP